MGASRSASRWLRKSSPEYYNFIILESLKIRNLLDCWSDREIVPGRDWQKEIEKAISSTKVAVLLVRPTFLASEYITMEELPRILDQSRPHPIDVFWIPMSYSNYRHTEIAKYQSAHNPEEPLCTMEEPERDKILVSLSDRILEITRPYVSK